MLSDAFCSGDGHHDRTACQILDQDWPQADALRIEHSGYHGASIAHGCKLGGGLHVMHDASESASAQALAMQFLATSAMDGDGPHRCEWPHRCQWLLPLAVHHRLPRADK